MMEKIRSAIAGRFLLWIRLVAFRPESGFLAFWRKLVLNDFRSIGS
jgi:hypothetical protein